MTTLAELYLMDAIVHFAKTPGKTRDMLRARASGEDVDSPSVPASPMAAAVNSLTPDKASYLLALALVQSHE